MDIENKVYEENKGSSLSQKLSYGQITPDGISEAFWEPSRRSKTKFFTRTVNGLKPSTICAKRFILNV